MCCYLFSALLRILSVLKEHSEIINLLNSACEILHLPRFRFGSRWHTWDKQTEFSQKEKIEKM
jgi:hypothetical protein